jgi:hypothetical protein
MLRGGWSTVKSPGRDRRFFFAPKHPDQLWGPSSYSVGTRALYPAQSGQGLRLTTHHHLMLSLGMSGPLYLFSPIWLHGMPRHNFTICWEWIACRMLFWLRATLGMRSWNIDISHKTHFWDILTRGAPKINKDSVSIWQIILHYTVPVLSVILSAAFSQ